MKIKLLFVVVCCVFFLGGCSDHEEMGSFVPETIDVPDSISNNSKLGDTVVNYTNQPENLIVTKNVVVAHRGAWKKKNLPENSIASLREAIRLECAGSEFDIVLTADDSLVLSHDATHNKLVIKDSKYDDLIAFKLSNGEKLPTLREYIIAAKDNNSSTLLFCELKNYSLSPERRKVFVAKTDEVVKKLNAQNMVVYISFDYEVLKQLRALNPFSDLQFLSGDKSPERLKLDDISGIDYHYSTFKSRPEWIESAKVNNLNLNVWTVNDVENMEFFLKNKFKYITTDEPELLLAKSL